MRNGRMLMNGKELRIYMNVIYFKIISKNVSDGTEETHE
jgi:hypothetical protein